MGFVLWLTLSDRVQDLKTRGSMSGMVGWNDSCKWPSRPGCVYLCLYQLYVCVHAYLILVCVLVGVRIRLLMQQPAFI